MLKAVSLTIRDLLVGACIGVSVFSAGYVLGAVYPPTPRPAAVDLDFPTLGLEVNTQIRI